MPLFRSVETNNKNLIDKVCPFAAPHQVRGQGDFDIPSLKYVSKENLRKQMPYAKVTDLQAIFSRLSIKPNGYTCCNNRSYQEKHNYEIHITDFPATFYRT